MSDRLSVAKTYKLFIGGQFPRSESGRTIEVRSADGVVLAHASKASRKDLRDAVVAARAAFESASGWPRRSGYNRGQVLYRLAEMMEGKRRELVEAIEATGGHIKSGPVKKRASKPAKTARAGAAPSGAMHSAEAEVACAIDRMVHWAGWADKLAHVLGCGNGVAGPYHNFTTPEPSGVAVLVVGDEPSLLPLVSVLGAGLSAGATVIAVCGGGNPLPACVLAEALATSDLPAGAANILTGDAAELMPHIAGHREVDAIVGAGLSDEVAMSARRGSAENLKRVTIMDVGGDSGGEAWFDHERCTGPGWLQAFLEAKTVWHPALA